MWTGLLLSGEQHTWRRQAAASSPHLDEDGGFPRLWVAIETLGARKRHRRLSGVISPRPLSASTILNGRWRQARESASGPRVWTMWFWFASVTHWNVQGRGVKQRCDFLVAFLAPAVQHSLLRPWSRTCLTLLVCVFLCGAFSLSLPYLWCEKKCCPRNSLLLTSYVAIKCFRIGYVKFPCTKEGSCSKKHYSKYMYFNGLRFFLYIHSS